MLWKRNTVLNGLVIYEIFHDYEGNQTNCSLKICNHRYSVDR